MTIIDVVVPTVDGREQHLERCLESYRQNSVHQVRLHVVWNKPTCGVAWNEGADLARLHTEKGQYLHFTADDLETLPGWDVAAIRASEAGHMPACKLLGPDGQVQYYGHRSTEPAEGDIVEFSSVPFMSWGLWEQIGPSLDCHYYTDNWLSWRAGRLGVAPAYYPGYAFIHHRALEKRGAGMPEGDRMAHDSAIYEEAKRNVGSH